MILQELFENKHEKKKSRVESFLLPNYPKAFKAMIFAKDFHKGVRKDGITPEFDHQISIVRFLFKLIPYLQFPDETLAVAFLHDVSEDYSIGFDQIYSKFGNRIGRSVNLVTKKFEQVHRREDKLFQVMAKDPIASIVKGVDRIHNQSTMKPFNQEKRNSYLTFTDDMIIPMLLEAKNNFPAQTTAYDIILRVLGYQKSKHFVN